MATFVSGQNLANPNARTTSTGKPKSKDASYSQGGSTYNPATNTLDTSKPNVYYSTTPGWKPSNDPNAVVIYTNKSGTTTGQTSLGYNANLKDIPTSGTVQTQEGGSQRVGSLLAQDIKSNIKTTTTSSSVYYDELGQPVSYKLPGSDNYNQLKSYAPPTPQMIIPGSSSNVLFEFTEKGQRKSYSSLVIPTQTELNSVIKTNTPSDWARALQIGATIQNIGGLGTTPTVPFQVYGRGSESQGVFEFNVSQLKKADYIVGYNRGEIPKQLQTTFGNSVYLPPQEFFNKQSRQEFLSLPKDVQSKLKATETSLSGTKGAIEFGLGTADFMTKIYTMGGAKPTDKSLTMGFLTQPPNYFKRILTTPSVPKFFSGSTIVKGALIVPLVVQGGGAIYSGYKAGGTFGQGVINVAKGFMPYQINTVFSPNVQKELFNLKEYSVLEFRGNDKSIQFLAQQKELAGYKDFLGLKDYTITRTGYQGVVAKGQDIYGLSRTTTTYPEFEVQFGSRGANYVSKSITTSYATSFSGISMGNNPILKITSTTTVDGSNIIYRDEFYTSRLNYPLNRQISTFDYASGRMYDLFKLKGYKPFEGGLQYEYSKAFNINDFNKGISIKLPSTSGSTDRGFTIIRGGTGTTTLSTTITKTKIPYVTSNQGLQAATSIKPITFIPAKTSYQATSQIKKQLTKVAMGNPVINQLKTETISKVVFSGSLDTLNGLKYGNLNKLSYGTVQIQTPAEKTAQKTALDLIGYPDKGIPNVPVDKITRITPPPTIPGFTFPPLSFGGVMTTRIYKGKQRKKYTPSYEALIFNLRGKAPKKLTGFGTRPITKGFKWEFGRFKL